MIFDFTIKETSKTTISVRADTPDDAQKLFMKWYDKHTDDPTDTTIDDLLDDGYDGREIIRSVGKTEDHYPVGAIMLPEESNTPVEPKYTLHIRFADGSDPLSLNNRTLAQIGMELVSWGDKYYLFPEENSDFAKESTIAIYAVLKDKEETWFEME